MTFFLLNCSEYIKNIFLVSLHMEESKTEGLYSLFLLCNKFHCICNFDRFLQHKEQDVVISEGVTWMLQVLSYTFPNFCWDKWNPLPTNYLGMKHQQSAFRDCLFTNPASGYLYIMENIYLLVWKHIASSWWALQLLCLIPIYQPDSFWASHKSIFNSLTSRWHHEMSHHKRHDLKS